MSSGFTIKDNSSIRIINKYTFDFIESDNIGDKIVFASDDSLFTLSDAGIASFEKYDFNQNTNDRESWYKAKIREEDRKVKYELKQDPSVLISLSNIKSTNNEKIIFDGESYSSLDIKYTKEELESFENKNSALEASKIKEELLEIDLAEIRLNEMIDKFHNIEPEKIKELDIHVSMLTVEKDPNKIEAIARVIEDKIKETPELKFSWVQHLQGNSEIEEKILSSGIKTSILGGNTKMLLFSEG